MSYSKIGHTIKGRQDPKDCVYTPKALAKRCIEYCDIRPGSIVLDPCRGDGVFEKVLSTFCTCEYDEIEERRDFFSRRDQHFDWIVSNPPYSMLDAWLDHTVLLKPDNFAYLLAMHAVTPRRLERMESAGYGLAKMMIMKVFSWYGISAFCIFSRGEKSILDYDRKVWRHEQD